MSAQRKSWAQACGSARALVVAGLAAAFLFGCGQEEKEVVPEVTVEVTPAQEGSISQVIAAEAVIYPLEQAVISPKITAPITEFKVQRGSRVRKGQLLAVLENKDLTGMAETSKGNFEQADAGYVTSVDATIPQQVQKAELDSAAAKTAFDAQQRAYDSRKQLYDQGALPRRDLDAAAVALAQARAANDLAQKQLADLQRLGKEQAIKSARGSRLSAEGQMHTAEAQLSYSEIRSPINGVVTDRPLYPGDLATANQPILTVMNLSKLIAKAHIPEGEAAALHVGDAAQLSVDGVQEPIQGRVSLVSPALDPNSTTVEVWVEAIKPGQALRPGMTVGLSMVARTVKNAILIPVNSLFKNPDGGANYVVLAGADKKAHWKEVKPGIRSADQVQILSGLSANDPVITAGGYALPDTTKIKVQTAQPSEKDNKADDAGKAGDKDKD